MHHAAQHLPPSTDRLVRTGGGRTFSFTQVLDVALWVPEKPKSGALVSLAGTLPLLGSLDIQLPQEVCSLGVGGAPQILSTFGYEGQAEIQD